MVVSVFPMHTFYWGDWYKKIIGPERANQISLINSALNKGLNVSSHTDAPVVFHNLMMIMWTTVLVVLDKKPLKVDPMTLEDIVVLETIKEGNTVYEKGN